MQRNAERGERIDPMALDMVRGTKLDNGSYLDRLKAVPVEEQAARVRSDLRAEKPTRGSYDLVEVADAYDAIARQADAIVRAWNRACPDARELALQQIDGPVFDRTAAAQ